jgi:hypothetical protein
MWNGNNYNHGRYNQPLLQCLQLVMTIATVPFIIYVLVTMYGVHQELDALLFKQQWLYRQCMNHEFRYNLHDFSQVCEQTEFVASSNFWGLVLSKTVDRCLYFKTTDSFLCFVYISITIMFFIICLLATNASAAQQPDGTISIPFHHNNHVPFTNPYESSTYWSFPIKLGRIDPTSAQAKYTMNKLI